MRFRFEFILIKFIKMTKGEVSPSLPPASLRKRKIIFYACSVHAVVRCPLCGAPRNAPRASGRFYQCAEDGERVILMLPLSVFTLIDASPFLYRTEPLPFVSVFVNASLTLPSGAAYSSK